MIIKLIKYLGNDDNMSMMEEQFDMTDMYPIQTCVPYIHVSHTDMYLI